VDHIKIMFEVRGHRSKFAVTGWRKQLAETRTWIAKISYGTVAEKQSWTGNCQ